MIVLALSVVSTFAAEATRYPAEAFTEPCQALDVAAPEAGRVASVYVQRGSAVQAGDLLLELDTSVLEASRRIAEQRAAETAELDACRVDLQLKQRRYQTMVSLRRENAVTPEELLTAESDLRIAELKVRSAEDELARARLEVAEISARIEQRRIRAPICGVVTDVLKEAGEFVSASEPNVVTLVDLSRLRVTFYLPTAEALPLREGLPLEVLYPAHPLPNAAAPAVAMAGRIEHVSPVTQADSGRVRVDVLVDNAAGRYRSGLRCLLPSAGTSPLSAAAE